MGAPASDCPRIRVAAAIPAAGGLVVVRQHKGDRSYVLLPGGGVRWGEPLVAALAREVTEEIGLTISVERLLFVNDTIAPDGGKHVVNITFLAQATSRIEDATPQDPAIDAVEVVPFEALRGIDLRPPIADEIAAFFCGETSRAATYLGARWVPDDRLAPSTEQSAPQ
ncbi:MAG: NUDIX domain-containing protein [Coriobacteriia bacterium]|nr:NUDIX domain-containing protein [Coriobacteriia bacterium]